MDLIRNRFDRLNEILDGPKELREWRVKQQKGVQYRILFLYVIITLITMSVFQALFVAVFKLRQNYDETLPDSYRIVFTYAMFAFIIGTIIGNLLSGIISDRIGRRITLLLSLALSIPYVFVYTIVLWIVYAMDFGLFTGIIIANFAFFLGFLNNQLPIILASAFDVSSYLAQATTVVLILLIGGSFGPAVLKEMISFGISASTNNEWLFPFFGLFLSGVMVIPFALVYFFIPETLGKEVPPHPLEAMYTSVITEESERDSIASPSADPIQLLPPVKDVDHGWYYPFYVVKDVRAWILFWVTFAFYGAFISTTFVSLSAFNEYDNSLEEPIKSFGIVFIVERVVVAVIGLGIIFAISAQFPQALNQVGYVLLLRISLVVILVITLFFSAFTFLLSFAFEDWLYWIALLIYPTLMDVTFIASFVYLISVICLASNVGFRNESGFLFAFISTALLGALISFVMIYMTLVSWLEFLGFFRYPLILLMISISIGISVALSFWKLDSELNEPRFELRKDSTERFDKIVFIASPGLFVLIMSSVTLFFAVYSLF